jgi:hypothetical protein
LIKTPITPTTKGIDKPSKTVNQKGTSKNGKPISPTKKINNWCPIKDCPHQVRKEEGKGILSKLNLEYINKIHTGKPLEPGIKICQT